MSDEIISLSQENKDKILRRYGALGAPAELDYGTVKDFCDSADHLPFLSNIQGDLKDLQRPAALKMILGLVPPGSSLLEIGAGEPYVAHVLAELGHRATVVDPYDGSGRGPTEFEYYTQKYPGVRIIRDLFSETLREIETGAFDCIYSISVLEHVHQPALSGVFSGIERFLRPGGYSLHLIDHVLAGEAADFHFQQLTAILQFQSKIAGDRPELVPLTLNNALGKLSADIETYYLSAEGHNKWRGTIPYESFPFRKVVSVHTCKRKRGARDGG